MVKVYGPYLRKDGRQHVVLIDGERRRTVSYPKWLMEQHLGRELDPDTETVDHIDDDFTNNSLDNLRILTRKKHASEDSIRVVHPSFTCPWCDTIFTRAPNQVDHHAKQGKAGPFCTRSCAGKYGASVQAGAQRMQPAPRIPVNERIYYKKSKDQ